MLKITCLDKYGVPVSRLTQWDYGQTLVVDNISDFEYDLTQVDKVHFCNRLSPTALVVEATVENNQLSAHIPNDLLKVAEKIFAYIYLETEDSGKTTYTIELPVTARKKPDDVIYPDDEPVGHYATEEWVLEAIEEALEEYDPGGGGEYASINDMFILTVGNIPVEEENEEENEEDGNEEDTEEVES